ncbi:MAG: hypothetical protein K0R47_4418 [Brevibacillus sp.]|nr:hypothetical protein [Brevibacillus sp.]
MGKHDHHDDDHWHDKKLEKKHCHDDDDDDHHHHYKHKPDPGCSVENVRNFGHSTGLISYPNTIKVPVTLAEPIVVVCVEADIHLEKPALEIKRVLKTVILEQCELVNTFDPRNAKLFVRGFIRKNIEYATVDHASPIAVCGEIRHTTALVPFDFCTDITFPPGASSLQLQPDFSSSGHFLDKTGHGTELHTSLLGNRLVYNDKPYCQLVFSEFVELDVGQNVKYLNSFEKTFTVLHEKIILRLGLKVLQDQQVPMPTVCPPPHYPPPCSKK